MEVCVKYYEVLTELWILMIGTITIKCGAKLKNGELCTWFDQLEFSFFFFPFNETFNTPVCSTCPPV